MVKATNANLLQVLAKVNGATFFFDVHMQCFKLNFVGIGQYLLDTRSELHSPMKFIKYVAT